MQTSKAEKRMRQCVENAPTLFIIDNIALRIYLGISKNEYAVLALLKFKQYKNNRINITTDSISNNLRISTRTIKRALKELRKRKFIESKGGKYPYHLLLNKYHKAKALMNLVHDELQANRKF